MNQKIDDIFASIFNYHSNNSQAGVHPVTIAQLHLVLKTLTEQEENDLEQEAANS